MKPRAHRYERPALVAAWTSPPLPAHQQLRYDAAGPRRPPSEVSMKTTHAPVLARWLFLVRGRRPARLLGRRRHPGRVDGGRRRERDGGRRGNAARRAAAGPATAGGGGGSAGTRRRWRQRGTGGSGGRRRRRERWHRRRGGHGRRGRGGWRIGRRRRSGRRRGRGGGGGWRHRRRGGPRRRGGGDRRRRGGTTGTGGSATRWTCPSGSFTTPNPSTITLTKVAGVPPFDTLQQQRQQLRKHRRHGLVRRRALRLRDRERQQPAARPHPARADDGRGVDRPRRPPARTASPST